MKELNYPKNQRGKASEEASYKLANPVPADIVREKYQGYSVLLSVQSLAIFCLCEDCNTLEAEVERLREENETLKKQMEDDLK